MVPARETDIYRTLKRKFIWLLRVEVPQLTYLAHGIDYVTIQNRGVDG